MMFDTLEAAVRYWRYTLEADGKLPLEPATLEECFALREAYQPGVTVRILGQDAEVISWPYPVAHGAAVKVRTPGDPTTITECPVNPQTLGFLNKLKGVLR